VKNDTLIGDNNNNILYGDMGDDVLDGGGGDDYLYGRRSYYYDQEKVLPDESNTLHGGAGNDFLFQGGKNDVLDGGDGQDVAEFTIATTGITANLLLGTIIGAGSVTLLSIEGIGGAPDITIH
jgi:Ca2+-binding RTX toxin-like protein